MAVTTNPILVGVLNQARRRALLDSGDAPAEPPAPPPGVGRGVVLMRRRGRRGGR